MLRQGQRFYGEEDPSTSYQRRPVVAWELGQCYNTCYLCPGINATKAGRWPSKRGRQESSVVTLEQLYIPNIWSPRCCREREGREGRSHANCHTVICQQPTPPTRLRDGGPLNCKLVPTLALRSPRAAGWNCSCWRCISSTASFVC